MKKEFIKYSLLVLVCFSMMACNDWLSVKPKTEMEAEDLFSTEAGFKDALAGVYTAMTKSSLYGREMTYGIVDVVAQQWGSIGTNHRFANALKYEYEATNTKPIIDTLWSGLYNAIANANSILAYIDKSSVIFTGDNKQIIKGEALALRAFLHFDLLRLFCENAKSTSDEDGIPYVDELTKQVTVSVSPAKVVERVIQDLTDAATCLANDPVLTGREVSTSEDDGYLVNRNYHLNYYAVTALLARVQLYAGNLPDALEAAREIVGEPGSEPVAQFSLTTAAATDERLFDSELLFALEEGKMQDNIDVYFGESVIKNGINNSYSALIISINKRKKLFAQQDPADDEYRLKLWIQESKSATAVMPGKYVNVGCIPLIRLSELYYIAAECSANQGLAYLNTLRAHRGLAAMTEVTDLQAEIAKEYSKELMCEGQMFFYYLRLGLIRFGVFRTVAIEPEEEYVIPLPDDELDFGFIEYKCGL